VTTKLKCKLPGPWPLPFVGHLYLVIGDFFKNFGTMTKKYGNYWEARVDGKRFVVVNDLEFVKEFAKEKETNIRMHMSDEQLELVDARKHSIFFNSNVPQWKRNRGFALKAAASAQFNLYATEALIQVNLPELKTKLGEAADSKKVVCFKDELLALVVKFQSYAMFSRKNESLEEAMKLQPAIKQYLASLEFAVQTPPFLHWFLKDKIDESKKATAAVNERIDALMSSQIKKFEKCTEEEKNQTWDLVFTLLKGTKGIDGVADPEEKVVDRGDLEPMTHEEMRGVIREILLASTDTVLNNLSMFFAQMAANPEAQEKVTQELFDFVANGGSLADFRAIDKLEYLNAALLESFRFLVTLPALGRTVPRDMVVRGVELKKDDIVWMLMRLSSEDQSQWGDYDVTKFVPERFLQPNKDLQKKNFHFGLGPRSCPGKALGLLVLKLTAANTLSEFKLTFPESSPSIRTEFKGTGEILKESTNLIVTRRM
jgi:cytochrome P450